MVQWQEKDRGNIFHTRVVVLHNYLREYQSTDEIFMVYDHENIVVDDIDQQMAQSNNVGSSSRSHDREMQVQREEIVRTMWEDYIKD
ncbi:hypothetical protein H5410_057913 [Solanum commersonii]|uniref:Uncharacterized protein n=1 Tax=Solanum commersonii TaxID=4109 RepID=A0A9J5WP80_SOLCO|nr:hypothetical protein H5410_057913 [Solanum commersonii]